MNVPREDAKDHWRGSMRLLSNIVEGTMPRRHIRWQSNECSLPEWCVIQILGWIAPSTLCNVMTVGWWFHDRRLHYAPQVLQRHSLYLSFHQCWVRHGGCLGVDILLAAGADDINASVKGIGRPLVIAARRGRVEMVSALLRNGADPMADVDSFNVETALGAAVRHGHTAVCEALIAAGANVAEKDKKASPLHIAATEGHVEVISVLLDAGVDINIRGWFSGESPLHAAVTKNQVEAVQFLLNRGAPVDSRTFSNRTALFFAPSHRMVEILIEAGADVSTRDKAGTTPLFMAAGTRSVETVDLLLSLGADTEQKDSSCRTSLFSAAQHGKAQIVQLLLSHGANPNVVDDEGDTALLKVLDAKCVNCEDRMEIVKALLASGADPNWSDRQSQRTALHRACAMGKENLVTLLIDAGANVHHVAANGVMPLHESCRDRHMSRLKSQNLNTVRPGEQNTNDPRSIMVQDTRCANILIKAGASVNQPDANLNYPLFIACGAGNYMLVGALVDYGAKLEAKDMDDRTALNLAAMCGHFECLSLLICAGANVAARDCDGDVPLQLAFERCSDNIEYQRIVIALLSAGARITNVMRFGDQSWRSWIAPKFIARW